MIQPQGVLDDEDDARAPRSWSEPGSGTRTVSVSVAVVVSCVVTVCVSAVVTVRGGRTTGLVSVLVCVLTSVLVSAVVTARVGAVRVTVPASGWP